MSNKLEAGRELDSSRIEDFREVQTQKIIICIKWGAKFGSEYVNRLWAMARRNITGDFRLVCFTDDAEGIRSNVEIRALPELGCEHPQRTWGKWPKVALWGNDLGGLEGPVLFIDLDSIILRNIDDYFTLGSPNDVYLARNWAKPFSGMGQTSIFRFPVGKNTHILENFRNNAQAIADKYKYEQHYITKSVKGGIKFWPESWTLHFRLHCLPNFPFRYWISAQYPRKAKVVTFPGGPNPGDIVVGRWDESFPEYTSRIGHIRQAFSGDKSLKESWIYLKRFVLPPEWIADAWSEESTPGNPTPTTT
jgi:hypothetical protein